MTSRNLTQFIDLLRKGSSKTTFLGLIVQGSILFRLFFEFFTIPTSDFVNKLVLAYTTLRDSAFGTLENVFNFDFPDYIWDWVVFYLIWGQVCAKSLIILREQIYEESTMVRKKKLKLLEEWRTNHESSEEAPRQLLEDIAFLEKTEKDHNPTRKDKFLSYLFGVLFGPFILTHLWTEEIGSSTPLRFRAVITYQLGLITIGFLSMVALNYGTS